jgi:hypothetical protein
MLRSSLFGGRYCQTHGHMCHGKPRIARRRSRTPRLGPWEARHAAEAVFPLPRIRWLWASPRRPVPLNTRNVIHRFAGHQKGNQKPSSAQPYVYRRLGTPVTFRVVSLIMHR